jgi:hypothetical protein
MSSQEPEEPQAWQPTPQPSPPPPPPAGLMRNPVVPGATMTLLGGVLIVVGSFLPWLTATAPLVGTISRNGMEGGGDGIFTLILGVITILIGVTQLTATNMPTLLQRSPIITGAITGIVAVINYLDVQQRIEDVREESELIAASVGAGIWTLVVGAVLAIVGGVLVRKLPTA